MSAAYAQRIFAGFYGTTPPRFPNDHSFQGSFTFCRMMFTSNRREKRGWDTDYPGADINFSIRLSELTRTRVARQTNGTDPEYVVVRLTDPALFQCPFALMEDAGTSTSATQEVAKFREYLLKGGFVFVSDYWGELGKEQFDDEIGRVLPRATYPIVDAAARSPDVAHAVRAEGRAADAVDPVVAPQRREYRTRRHRSARRAGIADAHGRLMVVMIHNSDIPDGWEREGEDPEYFYRFSPDAYSVGIDVFLYAMTH